MTSLESEVDRLSQSLNAQRVVVNVAETNARKVAEGHAREGSNQVCLWNLRTCEIQELTSYLPGTRDRTTETVAQELC